MRRATPNPQCRARRSEDVAAPHGQRLGRRGEDVAAQHVQRLGWHVVARNWCPVDDSLRGELDLVALDGDELVFCEVKTRSGVGAGEPIAAVTPEKLRQLRRLAGAWLTQDGHRYPQVRIDVIGVHWPPAAVAPTIEHRRDVG